MHIYWLVILMKSIYVFNSMDHLEPRCKNCGSKIDYGTTTSYDDKAEAHRCNECNEIVE